VAFRGLFIGIDRYSSPHINELGCARRDATALEALFTDTLGGASVLLVNEEATRARIGAEFESLRGCRPDDTVVIGFSGHGSETHELVAHDTLVHDLGRTAIHLDQVQQWFARIPARRVVLFLDCCFSGGIGAKVLQIDAKPRDLSSVEARLDQLAGDGRLIFTASSADEPAYEHNRFRKGPRFRSGRFCDPCRWGLSAKSANGADGGDEGFCIENLRRRPAGVDVKRSLILGNGRPPSQCRRLECRSLLR
jgi:helicase